LAQFAFFRYCQRIIRTKRNVIQFNPVIARRQIKFQRLVNKYVGWDGRAVYPVAGRVNYFLEIQSNFLAGAHAAAVKSQ